MKEATATPGKQYLRIHEQATYLGVHPKTIGRLALKDPSFPAEISLSPGVHGVRVRSLTDLERWVASKRIEPRDVAEPSKITSMEHTPRGRGRPRKHPAQTSQ